MRSWKTAAIVCSGLRRSFLTGRYLAKNLLCPLIICADLNELSFSAAGPFAQASELTSEQKGEGIKLDLAQLRVLILSFPPGASIAIIGHLQESPFQEMDS